MNARDRAKVGEVFWVVVEHFYTPKDSHLCEKEYCVCKTEVYKMLPRWDEMVLHGPGPDGYRQLHYYKNKDIGRTVFRTPKEAALYALELTEKNDRVWAYMMGEEPMRRTWEKYLEEEQIHDEQSGT